MERTESVVREQTAPSPEVLEKPVRRRFTVEYKAKILAERHPEKARLVMLRFFAGRSLEEAAEMIGVSRATAQRHWTYARAWLYGRVSRE